jgi:hypothetical protein
MRITITNLALLLSGLLIDVKIKGEKALVEFIFRGAS